MKPGLKTDSTATSCVDFCNLTLCVCKMGLLVVLPSENHENYVRKHMEEMCHYVALRDYLSDN